MIDKLIDKAIGPLAGAVFGYYNLPIYGRVLYNDIRGKILKNNKENEFWNPYSAVLVFKICNFYETLFK